MNSQIQEKLEKIMYNLDEKQVYELNDMHEPIELNNVLTGLEVECFGILVGDVPDKIVYQLYYVNGEKLPSGALLDLDFSDTDRNELVFLFAGYLTQKYPRLEVVDVFNTYQQQTRFMLEKLRYFTLTSKQVAKYEGQNPLLIVKNAAGVAIIPLIDKVEFYRDAFGNRHQTPVEEDSNYVYIMLNKRTNLFKIGTSIRPIFRERTLQSQEPEVVIITYWRAPREIERELQNQFFGKRERGEWFSLRPNDLKFIRERMREFE